MNIKDLHKLFIGRLSPEGNETEMQEVCSLMCGKLHDMYPDFFLTPQDYYEMNKHAGNAEKLLVN